ncbi:putative multiple-sugar transport system permease YteP [uncultured Clostridium sp.]|jgi:putative aldouronate transport system permease protein
MAKVKLNRMERKLRFKSDMKRYGNLFPFYIPAVVFALVFSYMPMLGLVMAFKENPNLLGSSSAIAGILEADWVGLQNFKMIFSNPKFLSALSNTLIISFLKIVLIFPLPIVLAIIINEMRSLPLKRSLQVVMYIPYFLSWATIAGVFVSILATETGVVNNIIAALGHERYQFLNNNDFFRGLLLLSSSWKDIGWSAVTYIAAITALDPALNEAARIDGATKFQQIRYVTIPGIMPTIASMFILRVGYIMDAGFEQVFVFYSPFVEGKGNILGMYTWRLINDSGLVPQYALSTAVGFFNSFVALTLVVSMNFVLKRFFNKSIW